MLTLLGPELNGLFRKVPLNPGITDEKLTHLEFVPLAKIIIGSGAPRVLAILLTDHEGETVDE